ncbi:hypothetical protein Goshw_022791 [Gossypium schwendimanii]|uniref:DUF7745 domain-containing protein n=1 Tax=Gossypium schwendimanii TaxID=34291 RepID=A0A7J9MYQ1_GOSSC|nr:hypothetical protein [Gossypium schwendimanii]
MKKVDVFALSIYGLVVFPKALGHVDEAVTDLFNRLDKWVTPVPAILAETFRSLNECRREGDGYKKKIQEMTNAWRQTRRMKRLAVCLLTTLEYIEWLGKRVNDNIPMPSQGDNQLAEKHLENKIKQMKEEKMNLKLGIDVQKLETKNLRNGKHKAEEDLNSLKTDYKKLRLLVRTTGLGKTSEQWRQEIQEEKIRASRDELKARVAELEKTVHQYRNRNSVVELQTSLSKIEQMKKTVEELKMALQNCEAKIEYLEANEDHQNKQLHYFQDQITKRDHIMGEVVVQIQEVAERLQTLAIQADILSVKYELESDRGQKLASLLKEIKVLTIRAKPYL